MSPQADALSTRIMRFLLPQMLSTHFVIFISKLSVPGSEKVTLHAEGMRDDTAIRGRKNCRYSSTNSSSVFQYWALTSETAWESRAAADCLVIP